MVGGDAAGAGAVRVRTRWATVGAALIGLAVVAGAAILVGGMPVGSVPSAAASTTDATPWNPRPATRPSFYPPMESDVSSGQGEVRSPKESNPVIAWAAKVSDAGQDIENAVLSAESAMGAGDLAGVKAACERMNSANQRLSAGLPTPVSALTREVEGIVSEIGAAYRICQNAGPDAGQAEIDAFRSHVGAAQAHYERARQIGAEASGPRDRPGLPN